LDDPPDPPEVVKAAGLKHDGRHCVEFLLDGHGPERTPWVEDSAKMLT